MPLDSETKGTGALLDPKDFRDIPFGGFVADTPESHTIDISKIPVMDQKRQPACVGYARAVILTHLLHKDTGSEKVVSPDFGYALAKKFDGYSGGGTFPRLLALKNKEVGALLDEDFNADKTKKHDEYIQFELTEKIKIKAALQRIQGFYDVGNTEAQLCNAIAQGHLVEVTLPSDGKWNGSPFKNDKRKKTTFHRVVIYGYSRKQDDTYFYVRNSWGENWGKNGNGEFGWKDFAGQVYDTYIFADVPDEHLREVRKIPVPLEYVWTTNLIRGSRGHSVEMLQYALKHEGCMGILEKADGIFGMITKGAVERMQAKYGITQDGIVGGKTRELLNANYKPSNLLHKWALAIQKHEGYYPPGTVSGYPNGSLSWKNRNPGNIRYMGRFRSLAIGKDKNNFCIFETYEKGFDALKSLLISAATPDSNDGVNDYRPNMSLLQFFEKYAPRGDSNDPVSYAREVAKQLGVPVDTPISNLIA